MMNAQEIVKLKGEGILAQKQSGFFNIRILSRAGEFTADELAGCVYLAKTYGNGTAAATTRLSLEIPFIKEEDIPKVKEECVRLGLKTGGTGKRVRPVAVCKGGICPSGIYDAQALAKEANDVYFPKDAPHKFKICFAGCPNNCSKCQINDIGVMGYEEPNFNLDKCIGCGMCMKNCRAKAIEIVDKKVVFHPEKCVNCGRCVASCRLGVVEAVQSGVKIFVGGRFGRQMRIGSELHRIYQPSEVIGIIGKVLDYFRAHAQDGERLALMMERLGEEKVLAELNEICK